MRNSYADPTANTAIANVDRELRRERKRREEQRRREEERKDGRNREETRDRKDTPPGGNPR